jgi:hypothetical protein
LGEDFEKKEHQLFGERTVDCFDDSWIYDFRFTSRA